MFEVALKGTGMVLSLNCEEMTSLVNWAVTFAKGYDEVENDPDNFTSLDDEPKVWKIARAEGLTFEFIEYVLSAAGDELHDRGWDDTHESEIVEAILARVQLARVVLQMKAVKDSALLSSFPFQSWIHAIEGAL